MPREIRPGVYDVTTREDDNGRRYRAFLFDDDVPTLVDAGHADTGDVLVGKLEELGVEPERLLVTHGDHDHVGGVRAVVERFGVDLYLPAGLELDAAPPETTRLDDGDEVGPFTAVHVPGHAAAHAAYVHGDREIAVMGDAVFGSDLRGLPTGYFVLPPAVYSEDLNLADASLEKLLDYEFEVALLYHGSSVTEDARGKLARFVEFPGKP